MESIIITMEIEKSDHDGNCSGGECGYSAEVVTYIMKYSALLWCRIQRGDVDEVDLALHNRFSSSTMPVNDGGSYYCDVENTCLSVGLQRHDWRIARIIAAELSPLKSSHTPRRLRTFTHSQTRSPAPASPRTGRTPPDDTLPADRTGTGK